MSLKFPPHGSVHENRIKPLPLSLPERAEGEWGRGGRLQFVEVGADLLENLLHGALGVELGAEGLAGEGGSPEELFQGWILATSGEIMANLGQRDAEPSLEGVSVLGTGGCSRLQGIKSTTN